MSQRAQQLADEFQRLSNEFIATIEGYSQSQIDAVCEGEQCTVAALGSHVAVVHELTLDWIRKMLSGDTLPTITMDMVDQMNAEQFARDAHRPKDEVLAALRRVAEEAHPLVRGLSDEELHRSAYLTLFKRNVTVEDLIRLLLIGDIETHLPSMQRAGDAAAIS